MRVSTSYLNFSRGKADHDLNARNDLPIYTTACEIFKNFYGNFKGNALFRNGFQDLLKFEDCVMIEFEFNEEQSYICLFTDNKVKFLTYDSTGNFGFVQSGGADLEIASPYSLEEAREIDYDQNADVMYIVHPDYAPRKLTRTAADAFNISTFSRTSDPFTGADDYPSCVSFYTGYLYYGATNNEPTTIWRSKGGDYDNLSTGTEDDDGLKFAVAELTEKFQWLFGGNKSLIGGSSQGLVTINGGSPDEPITPTTVSANLTNSDGASSATPLRKEDLIFFINQAQRNVKYISYDIITEDFKTNDANVISYDISAGKFKRMVFKEDKNNLVWIIDEAGDLFSLNFNQAEKIVGWAKHESVATFEDICMISNNDGIKQLFCLLKYDSEYFVCRMSEQPEFELRDEFYTDDDSEEEDTIAYNRYTSEILKECNYLDLSQSVYNYYTSTITYLGDTEVGGTGVLTSSASDFSASDVGSDIWYKTDTGREWGIFTIDTYTSATRVEVTVVATPTALSYSKWYRTFTTITGLTDFAGETMSVVADGGYLGDYAVDASGQITLDRKVTVAWVGFKYEGLIKTFNLGFSIQGVNTQTTPKNLYKAGIRFVYSAGGLLGTTLYDMNEIQEWSVTGEYDLPPIPMDGNEYVNYNDNFDREKSIYIKQDKPLPLNVTGLIAQVSYGQEI